MTIHSFTQRGLAIMAALLLLLSVSTGGAQDAPDIALATLGEPNPVTPEISTR